MQRAIEVADNVTCVRLSGVWTMDEFEPNKAMLAQLESAAPPLVEFDFEGVQAIDSAGIGMLLLANDRFSKANIRFRLSGVKGAVAQILEVAKIGQLIEIIQAK